MCLEVQELRRMDVDARNDLIETFKLRRCVDLCALLWVGVASKTVSNTTKMIETLKTVMHCLYDQQVYQILNKQWGFNAENL